MSNTLKIRSHTYRGKNGFLVYGRGRGIYGTRIFTLTRASAERIRERLYAGQEIEPEDWELEAENA